MNNTDSILVSNLFVILFPVKSLLFPGLRPRLDNNEPLQYFSVPALDHELEPAQVIDAAASSVLGGQLEFPLSEFQLLEGILELVPVVEVAHQPKFLKKTKIFIQNV